MKSNRRNNLVHILLLCVTVGVFVSILFLIKGGMTLFQVKRILVTGDPVQIEINKAIFVNNTIFFPTESVARQLKLDNPLIRSVEIRKRYPSTLEFAIYRRVPIAEIVIGGIQFGIDEDCVVTEVKSGSNMPVILTNVSLVHIGTTIGHPMVTQAIALIVKTKGFMEWSLIEPYETQSIRARSGKTDIIITQISNLSEVRDTLQTLMEGFRIKGTIPKSIDLRFGKPIVQF